MTTPTCPNCGKVINQHLCYENTALRPKPDDYSICIYCLVWLQFDQDQSLRLADLRDMPVEVREDLETVRELFVAKRGFSA